MLVLAHIKIWQQILRINQKIHEMQRRGEILSFVFGLIDLKYI
jgi:hypothetical protein